MQVSFSLHQDPGASHWWQKRRARNLRDSRRGRRPARRAGLDPATARLYKWRATYCVELMREGVDLPSVQRLLGHKNLQTTARYCAPLEKTALRERLDKVKAFSKKSNGKA